MSSVGGEEGKRRRKFGEEEPSNSRGRPLGVLGLGRGRNERGRRGGDENRRRKEEAEEAEDVEDMDQMSLSQSRSDLSPPSRGAWCCAREHGPGRRVQSIHDEEGRGPGYLHELRPTISPHLLQEERC